MQSGGGCHVWSLTWVQCLDWQSWWAQLLPRSATDWEHESPTIHSIWLLSLQKNHAVVRSKSQGWARRTFARVFLLSLILGECQPVFYAWDDTSDWENKIIPCIILENKLISYSYKVGGKGFGQKIQEQTKGCGPLAWLWGLECLPSSGRILPGQTAAALALTACQPLLWTGVSTSGSPDFGIQQELQLLNDFALP